MFDIYMLVCSCTDGMGEKHLKFGIYKVIGVT